MKKWVGLIMALLVTFSYGFLSGKFQIFPYDLIRVSAKNLFSLAKGMRLEEEFPISAQSFVVGPVGELFGGTGKHTAFDILSTDMDLDGDLDILINWHHLHPLELFENSNGEFRRVMEKLTGIYENSGVPSIYASEEEMIFRIQKKDAQEGLYVWHDLERKKGWWRFYLKTQEHAFTEARLFVRSNRAFSEGVHGLKEGEYERIENKLSIVLKRRHVGTTFGIKVQDLVATQLKLWLQSENRLPIFVGRECVRMIGEGPTSLWKSDPHGIAWVDVQDSPEPDLFVSRGGLAGTLLPPHEPKRNYFYVYEGRADSIYQSVSTGIIPADYGRARKVEWVDINNDKIKELYIGNEQTPNALLLLNSSTGVYEDTASKLGLSFVSGEVFAWFDWDADSYQDLLFLVKNEAVLAHNKKGQKFEILAGYDLGIKLPRITDATETAVFDTRSLHLFDFNNDGRLDVWVSGWEAGLTNHLFIRKEDGFIEVTDSFNLSTISDTRILVCLDVNNDGTVDALSIGDKILLLKNNQGKCFKPEIVDLGDQIGEIKAATIGDFNDDGGIDLLLVSNQLFLALNRLTRKHNSLIVEFSSTSSGAPVGTLVRAYFGDGSIQAQRYGSARNSRFSQVLQPLHFGNSQGKRLEKIGVYWPGRTDEIFFELSTNQKNLLLAPKLR